MSLQLAGLEANYLVSIYTPFGFYVYKTRTLDRDRKCVSGVYATYIPRNLVLIDAVYDILAEDRVLSVLQNCESAYCIQLCDLATSGDLYCEYGIIIQDHNNLSEFVYVDIMSRFYRAMYDAIYIILDLFCKIKYKASYTGLCAAMHESQPVTSLTLRSIHSKENRRDRVEYNSYTNSVGDETALDNVIQNIHSERVQSLGGLSRGEKRSSARYTYDTSNMILPEVFRLTNTRVPPDAKPSTRRMLYVKSWQGTPNEMP